MCEYQVSAFTSLGCLPRNGIARSHPIDFCTKHNRRPGELNARVLLSCFNRTSPTPLVGVLSSDYSREGQGGRDRKGRGATLRRRPGRPGPAASTLDAGSTALTRGPLSIAEGLPEGGLPGAVGEAFLEKENAM